MSPKLRIGLQLLIALVVSVVAEPARSAADARARPFWRSLRDQEFKVPADTVMLPLALEATRLLGSTDPELRDAIGYEALEAWIYRDQRLSPAELDELRVVLMRNALHGLGNSEDDSLFLRSFSDLALSVLAAQDLRASFLGSTAFNALVDLGLRSLQQERDLRGYVPHKGWGHATAHCADLLKFLARNPQLTPDQQGRVIEAIAHRLQTAGRVFTWGEDARLAAVLSSLAHRPDADLAPFEAWFKSLREEHARVWTGTLEPARYVRERAQLNALAELAAELDTDVSPERTQAVRAALRALRVDLR